MAYLDENGLAYFKGKLDQITDNIKDNVDDINHQLFDFGSAIYTVTLRNGSFPNSGNSNAVTIREAVIPQCSQGDIVTIETDRPVSAEGNSYRFWWYELASNKDRRVAFADTVDATTITNEHEVSSDNAAYLTWAIVEVDSNNNYVPLRITDFANYRVTCKIQYASGKVFQNFNELRGDLSTVIGYYEKTFTLSKGTHSSDNDRIKVNIKAGQSVSAMLDTGSVIPNGLQIFYVHQGSSTSVASSYANNWMTIGPAQTDVQYVGVYVYGIPSETTATLKLIINEAVLDAITNLKFTMKTLGKYGGYDIYTTKNIRDGTPQNPGNVNCVRTIDNIPVSRGDLVWVYTDRPADSETNGYTYGYVVYNNSNVLVENWTVGSASLPIQITASDASYIRITMGQIAIGTDVPIRAIDFIDHPISFIVIHPNSLYASLSDLPEPDAEVTKRVKNARHPLRNQTTPPLTLLHFSDIHQDTNALSRIMNYYDSHGDLIDGAICTGDIRANDNGQIADWWDNRVLTCIGNHDSALYSGGTYDWVALSMADRDNYYIAPFEENWDIVHTSGLSYYYKDFTDQKVRLIVMDAMLYSSYEEDTSLAQAQTTWLENLLADAITNQLHVVIAIHAPHGGASSKDCSFSKYGATTMPTYSDCNTPQSIIDTVAAKITSGLKFVGYLVGHTHQDNIWDAENDGKQLMYCVTCAHVQSSAQWGNSDQHRDTDSDAYNLVTIDTTKSLVKIVRGGGADIDDRMRLREAICIDYSTGTIIGEIT